MIRERAAIEPAKSSTRRSKNTAEHGIEALGVIDAASGQADKVMAVVKGREKTIKGHLMEWISTCSPRLEGRTAASFWECPRLLLYKMPIFNYLNATKNCPSRGHRDISPLGEQPPSVSAFPTSCSPLEPQHLCPFFPPRYPLTIAPSMHDGVRLLPYSGARSMFAWAKHSIAA